MSTVTVLESIKAFLEENVTPKIQLQKDSGDNVANYEVIIPGVHTGWLPPKGYIPPEMQSIIPCLIVGFDEGTDDSESKDMNIRISAVVYSPGQHGADGVYMPDYKGYVDLLNLLDRTKAEIMKNRIINNYVTVQYPVKWGMYQEQPYPYWYGWITFTVRKQGYPASEILKNL